MEGGISSGLALGIVCVGQGGEDGEGDLLCQCPFARVSNGIIHLDGVVHAPLSTFPTPFLFCSFCEPELICRKRSKKKEWETGCQPGRKTGRQVVREKIKRYDESILSPQTKAKRPVRRVKE